MVDLRILVVANKNWEADPLVGVLLSRRHRPESLKIGALTHYTDAPRPPLPRPRLTCSCTLPKIAWDANGERGTASKIKAEVEVFCVEDWMTPGGNTSSSKDKFEVSLPAIKMVAQKPDLVIAFGTAGMPSSAPIAGSVTLGSRVYIVDPWKASGRTPRDPPLDLPADKLRTVFESPRLHDKFFRGLSYETRHAAEARFLRAPLAPAEPPIVLSGKGYGSVGTINIVDYDDYIWADEITVEAYGKDAVQREIGSLETTHGLIRLTWPDTTFLFVSGLVDRHGAFNAEVTPRVHSQNFVASQNAGVLVAYLIPALLELEGRGLLRTAS